MMRGRGKQQISYQILLDWIDLKTWGKGFWKLKIHVQER